jgi:hypothetical protein
LARIITSLCLVMTGGGFSGSAGAAGRDAKPWTRIEMVDRYLFEGDVVQGRDLSGLAFISDRFGLLGADEARQVQVVEMVRPARLRVLETITLRSGRKSTPKRLPPRGTAITSSARMGPPRPGQQQQNRYRIFRLQVDRATGRPSGPPAASLKAASLADVLRADPVLGPHLAQPLQRRGVNIEGLAARNGRLYVGFRSPNLQGDALVMEIRADDVFAATPRSTYTLHRLRLGPGLGIRDLAAARSGFLLMAGNAGSEPSPEYPDSQDYEKDREFFLFHWDGKVLWCTRSDRSQDHRSGRSPDHPGGESNSTTVLVLFDGPEGGRPTVYRIS